MDLLEFIVIVLFLELTPGPNMAYLAMLTLTHGRRAGWIAILGILSGLALHAVVAAFGAGILMEKFPWLYQILRWVGVGYLFYLAWEGWQTEKQPASKQSTPEDMTGSLFLRGFFSNVFNPKSILFFVSVVPRFIKTDSGTFSVPLQMAMLSALYLGIATFIHGAIVLLAVQARPYLMEESRVVITRRILAVALVLVAMWLAWTTR